MKIQTPYLGFSNQIGPAEHFAKENADRIALITEVLLKAASEFLGKCQHHFPEEVFKSLTWLHQEKELVRFQRVLRHNPISAACLMTRGAYWSLNDAFSHLEDALGIQWKYLSFEGRGRSLDFADQAIADFERYMAAVDVASSTALAIVA